MAKKPERSLSKIARSETNDLLEMVLKDIDLGLKPAEESKLREIARSHVNLEPDVLRVCEIACPAHDMCPFIRGVAKGKRPYGKRCPMEALRYRTEFENFVQFVLSLDPDADEDPAIPAVELGLCKEVAFMSILEHRAKIEIGRDPNVSIEIAIPGARGETGRTDNPAFRVFSQVAKDKRQLQQMLYKMAQERLKRVEKVKKEKLKTVRELQDKYRTLDKIDPDSALGKLFKDAENKVSVNEKKMLDALQSDTDEDKSDTDE